MAKKSKDPLSKLPTGYPKPKFPKMPKAKKVKGPSLPKSGLRSLPKVGGIPRAPKFK